MKLFLSPHNDDEALFGSFTILREKPVVAIVFDSHVQFARGTGITAATRREESAAALNALGAGSLRYLGFSDAEPDEPGRIEKALSYFGIVEHVYAPAIEPGGHAQHNLIGEIADRVFGDKVTHYLTYTRDKGKSVEGREVPIERGDWIARKLRALACYTSQHALDPRLGCWPHFLRDQREYYAA